MSRTSHIVAVVLAALSCACNPFKAEVPEIKAGVESFEKSEFADAEKHFDEALRDEPSSEAHFGKGASLYAQHKLPDATEQFNRALNAKEDALRSRAYLDLGNTHATGGMLDKAIESYKRALEIDPADPDARYNLEWALREQEKQQKQQGKQGDQQQAGNKGQDDKNQQQQGGDQQKSDQQQAKNDGQGEQKGPDQPGEKKDGENGEKKDEQQGKSDEAQQKQADQGQPKPGEQQAQNGAQPQKQDGQDGQKPGEEPQAAQNGAPGEKGQEPQANAGDRSGQQGGPSERIQPAKPMNRQETAQVLDALQAGEKNLQMWRFQKKDDAAGRNAVDEDW